MDSFGTKRLRRRLQAVSMGDTTGLSDGFGAGAGIANATGDGTVKGNGTAVGIYSNEAGAAPSSEDSTAGLSVLFRGSFSGSGGGSSAGSSNQGTYALESKGGGQADTGGSFGAKYFSLDFLYTNATKYLTQTQIDQKDQKAMEEAGYEVIEVESEEGGKKKDHLITVTDWLNNTLVGNYDNSTMEGDSETNVITGGGSVGAVDGDAEVSGTGGGMAGATSQTLGVANSGEAVSGANAITALQSNSSGSAEGTGPAQMNGFGVGGGVANANASGVSLEASDGLAEPVITDLTEDGNIFFSTMTGGVPALTLGTTGSGTP